MKRAILSLVLPFVASGVLVLALAAPAAANERDRTFFRTVEGQWVGPGEIVAGKYKGTKFVCTFEGSTPGKKVGMTLDGGCRVGMITQKMTASVEYAGTAGYKGTFMDGAKGEGLDIISGNVLSTAARSCWASTATSSAASCRLAWPMPKR